MIAVSESCVRGGGHRLDRAEFHCEIQSAFYCEDLSHAHQKDRFGLHDANGGYDVGVVVLLNLLPIVQTVWSPRCDCETLYCPADAIQNVNGVFAS